MSNLSNLLRKAREHKGATLREVEEETGISNAYISQIEKGKVTSPSPRKLKSLSDFYSINYQTLMEAAGHEQVSSRHREDSKVSAMELLNAQDITDEEARALVSFLKTFREMKTQGQMY